MVGILNGCDYNDWSTQTDPYIEQNYQLDTLELKTKNKLAIQKSNKMQLAEDIPVIAMVSRLTDQKGLNYLLPAIKQLVHHRVQIMIAGTGDPLYVDQLEYLAKKYPETVHFHHGFSEHIAHTYMAGADFFMMPSLFEPCGLTQMYALAYGTLPVVREVGGLKDTVVDISQPNATGVVFREPNPDHLVSAVRNGLLCYYETSDKFDSIRKRAMQTKFLWSDSALQYQALYQRLHQY
jgi:starch synthase